MSVTSRTVSVDSVSLSVTSNQPVTWFGQPVTFTAKLGSPVGGSIQFSEGSTVLGSGTLSVGVATLTASDLPAGTHTITASWPGDTNWSAASAQLVQTVNRANTVTAATISGGVARAVVTAVAPGAGNPGGTVRFVDIANNAVLVSAVLDSGRANFTLPASGNPIEAVYVGDGNFLGSTSAPISQLAAVNAASYGMASVAPDEIVTLFGQNLAGENLSAAQPAATLGGLAVTVTDSTGVSRVTPLLFVSPTQASVLMPPDLATGPAMIRAARSGGVTVSTAITITRAAPGLFAADGSGEGTPAAQIIRIHADGTREAAEAVTSAPIDLGDPGDVVYLVLYGTGIRHFIAAPTCMIGGQAAAVAFAGAQDSFPGLDQVNVRVPDVMRGAGTVKLTLTVDGIDSNAATVSFH
jgi:uncharacterized protein (TIGR03437 family)